MATSGVSTNSFIKSLQQSSTQEPVEKNKGEIGQTEFLNMLVTQLKNQDPMNPMDNDQFAVNLAQFSQLEQLVSINGKLGSTEGGGGDFSSLASYLGNEVVLNTETINVEKGQADSLQVNLPTDAYDVMVDLIDKSGQVVETKSLGAVTKGKHTLNVSGLQADGGEYQFKVRAKTTAGSEVRIDAAVAGIVSGFMPGADPMLLVGGREVSPSDVKEVHLNSAR